MRWILCALLLFFPAVTASAAPTFGLVLPAAGTFTASKTVQMGVSNITGTVVVTVRLTGGTPFTAVPDAVFEGVWTVVDLGLVTQDPLIESNTALHIVATDDTGSAEMDRTYTFDDQKPTSTMTISPPPPGDPNAHEFTTTLKSIRVTGGEMHDNDPHTVLAISARGVTITPDDGDSFSSQRIALAPGLNVIFAPLRDRAGNTPEPTFRITRLTVCDDPNYPIPDSDPDTPDPVGTTYSVDRLDDLPDPIPDDDICDVRPDLRGDSGDPFVPPLAGHCTLRAAIQTANHHPGDDTILIFSNKVPLRFQGVPGDTEGAASGDLDVTDDLRIVGSGRDTAFIDGSKLKDRVFDVKDGVTLQLLKLTVQGGRAPKGDDPSNPEGGGCIRSHGKLQANNVAFLNCKADGAGGAILSQPPEDPEALSGGALTCAIVARSQSKSDGGGLAIDGTPWSVRNSTLSLNSAGVRGGAISALAGETPQDLVITNVTISTNKARQAGGALDLGAGVTAKINNTTFAGNTAKADSTFSTIDGGQVEVANSILGDKKRACVPAGPQPFLSKGGNVERENSCIAAPATGDQQNVDPKLDRLRTNSGPPTHALLLGSPAIDHAGTGPQACEPLDARDVERGDWPRADNAPGTGIDPCDAGAFELEVTPAP
jgi:hypothetical protein